MVKNFKDLVDRAIEKSSGKIIVVSADHLSILKVVEKSINMKLSEFILVGNEKKIESIIEENDLNIDSEIYDVTSHEEASNKAIELLKSNKGSLIMKGMLHSSIFLKALLKRENNLRTTSNISQVSIMEKKDSDGFILLTDCAISVDPDLNDKIQILKNAINLSNKLGVERPKVAVLSSIEVINPMMEDTLDAAALSKMSERGQLGNVLVDGPLALDNIMSKEAAVEKGIYSGVTGDPDIILMPNLLVGNSVSKAITAFANISMVSATIGMKIPIIFNSRTETIDGKILSIALAKYML